MIACGLSANPWTAQEDDLESHGVLSMLPCLQSPRESVEHGEYITTLPWLFPALLTRIIPVDLSRPPGHCVPSSNPPQLD
jgi:hypothetical protein